MLPWWAIVISPEFTKYNVAYALDSTLTEWTMDILKRAMDGDFLSRLGMTSIISNYSVL